MAITTNANRIRVESAAKNGTLGSQAGAGANQIIFDTNINTNNGNLEASPAFLRRHIVIRRGDGDEERNLVTSVDVDNVTCTCRRNWNDAPASGDTYEVAYTLPDIATIAGCTRTSGRFVFTKRLVIGNGTNFAFVGMGRSQTMEMHDPGPTPATLRVVGPSWFHVGTRRGAGNTEGAAIIFTNDGDGEEVFVVTSGGVMRMFDCTLIGTFAPDGVELAVDFSGTVRWRRCRLYGVEAPMHSELKELTGDDRSPAGGYITKEDIEASPHFTGWCKSEFDVSIIDAIAGAPAGSRVYIIVEDP